MGFTSTCVNLHNFVKRKTLCGVCLLLSLCCLLAAGALPGTAFSYQGRLSVSGAPATGSYDFKFTLFDAASEGTEVAGPVTNSVVTVSNGQFTTTLDFGGGVFDGNPRWLDIAVKTNGGSDFSLLLPRQPLTPTPYALYASGAATAAALTGTLSVGQLSGMVPLAQLPGGLVTNNQSGVSCRGLTVTSNLYVSGTNFANYLVISNAPAFNGSSITNLNPAALAGTINLANLPAAVVTNNASGITLAGAFTGNGVGLTNEDLALENSHGAITWSANWGNFVLGANVPVPNASIPVVADFNGDGWPDLACGAGNRLYVYTNNQQGGFALAANIGGDGSPNRMIALDVNGDGKVDLVCGHWSDSKLSVFTNNGSGGFALASSPATDGYTGSGLVGGDFRGDDKVELICAQNNRNYLVVLTNAGNGVFASNSIITVDADSNSSTRGLAAADMNGDGKLDLICTDHASANNAQVLTNNGMGGFVAVGPVVTLPGFPDWVAAADFNGDGLVDFVTANGSGNSLSVCTNNGAGRFGVKTNLPLPSTAFSVLAVDINGDGRLDVLGTTSAGTLSVYTNDGAGGFGLMATLTNALFSAGYLAAADINRDGRMDVATASYGNNSLGVFLNTPASYGAPAAFQGSFAGSGAGLTNIPSAALTGPVLAAQLPAGLITNGQSAVSLGGTFTGNGAGLSNLNASAVVGLSLSNVWTLGGNNVAPGQFLGSTNNQPLEFQANGRRVLRLESVEGGFPNVVGGDSINTIASGVNTATIAGGAEQHIGDNGNASTIGGGYGNSVQGGSGFGTIAGGGLNLIASNAPNATISGGLSHLLALGASNSVIAGGYGNTSAAPATVIGGGLWNSAYGANSTVPGGRNNFTYGDNSVAMGYFNRASGFASFAMGEQSTADGDYSVAMGYTSRANGQGSTALGSQVVASGSGSTALGVYNYALSEGSTALGENTWAIGANSTALGHSSTASGNLSTAMGSQTRAGGTCSTAMGSQTQAGGVSSTAMGGGSQANADYSFAVGQENFLDDTAYGSSIVGGGENTNSGTVATIGGGYHNTIQSLVGQCFLGAGQFNTIETHASQSFLGGGEFNSIQSDAAHAFLGSGYSNSISGPYGVVPGGDRNTAGASSFAAGHRAKATHQNAFLWADGNDFDFPSTAANQVRFRATGSFDIITAIDATGEQTAGVWLSGGDSSWRSISDRNAKKGIQPVDGAVVLEKLAQVPVSQWHYKWEADNATPHLGPMAQDFITAFYPGRDDKSISTLEFDGVEMAAIQALNQKLKEKDAEIAALQAKAAEVDQLKQRLEALEKLLTPANAK